MRRWERRPTIPFEFCWSKPFEPSIRGRNAGHRRGHRAVPSRASLCQPAIANAPSGVQQIEGASAQGRRTNHSTSLPQDRQTDCRVQRQRMHTLLHPCRLCFHLIGIHSKLRSVAMGHEQTHAVQQKSGGFKVCLSSVQVVKQDLRLFQIERVEAFGEPVIDRSEQIAGLVALASITVEPRHAHRCA